MGRRGVRAIPGSGPFVELNSTNEIRRFNINAVIQSKGKWILGQCNHGEDFHRLQIGI